jgi:CheY-like chemotaxis protein
MTQPGDFVQIVIRDSGVGIAHEIQERIFDPYFTTKKTGKGTGMGLAIVHGIVKSYDGFITCHSQVGEGAVFQINLPALDEQPVDETKPEELIQVGTERILLIDDEKMLAELGQTMLERLGYRVTARTNSLDALTTFQKQPDAFDLVISDQTMPGMTGIDLALRMFQVRPHLPFILCTGFSASISEEKARAVGIKGFAIKPLANRDLAALIRKVLE